MVKKGKSSSILDIIPYFLAAFVVFFLLGFFAGLDHRPVTFRQKAYERTRLVSTANDKYFLYHECPGEGVTHYFDVDEDTVGFEIWFDIREDQGELPTAENSQLRSLFTGLLGSVIGGAVTYQSVLQATRVQSFSWKVMRRTIATVIGGISGYKFGFKAGSNYDIGCTSKTARQVLASAEDWEIIERDRLLTDLLEIRFTDESKPHGSTLASRQEWGDDPTFQCNTAFKTALNKYMTSRDKSFNSQHFAETAKLKRVYKDIVGSEPYRYVRQTSKSHWQAETLDSKSPNRSGLKQLLERRGYEAEKYQSACDSLNALILAGLN